MADNEKELYLRFLRSISEEPGSINRLREALAGIAYYFHISAIETELLGDADIDNIPREMVLFEREKTSVVGEPFRFDYELSSGIRIVIYIYADKKDFSEEDKKNLEVYATECSFVIERHLLNRHVELAGTRQYVTKLFNTDGFIDRVNALVAQGYKLSDYCSCCFNLRGFGDVNRQYGRNKGNEVLAGYAYRLSSMLGEDEVIGHIGADTFIALINRNREQWFVDLLENIPVEIEIDDRKETVHVEARVGVWEIDRDDVDMEDLVDRPYMGLNKVKTERGQRVEYVTEKMLKQESDLKAVLKYFEKALEDEEFKVYYQPKVDSTTGMLVGAEGLVRWFHDDKMISPGIFIPALEDNAKIILLDYYILKHACDDIKEWMDKGYDPVPVSVNFSRRDLKDRDLAKKINAIIEESGIDKRLIEVELTETVDSEEHGVLSGFIDELYKMDIMTAVDDFGAGYSSLATLREFSVHSLKLDRSFVNTDDFSWKDEIILRDVIHMAGELSMEVLCEGVERDDQLALLNSVGCYVIQGYYYDRPLPKEEYEKRVIDKQYKK